MGAINWESGACYGLTAKESEAVFFPKSGRPRKIPPYRRFCGACPIKYSCYSYAIVHDEWGIWGGTTEEDRKAMQYQTVPNLDFPNLVPGATLKATLTYQAKLDGWYEDHSYQLNFGLPQPDLPESDEQTLEELDMLVDQPLVAVLRPSFGNDPFAGSIGFQSPFAVS